MQQRRRWRRSSSTSSRSATTRAPRCSPARSRLAERQPASFAGGAARGPQRCSRGLGVDLAGDRIYDGSGLVARRPARPGDPARRDPGRRRPPTHPDLRSVVADLPVAGFTGSLAYRFRGRRPGGPGHGARQDRHADRRARAGRHGDRPSDGAVMSFVAIADRVRLPNTLAARARCSTRSPAALAGCTCAARQPVVPAGLGRTLAAD